MAAEYIGEPVWAQQAWGAGVGGERPGPRMTGSLRLRAHILPGSCSDVGGAPCLPRLWV